MGPPEDHLPPDHDLPECPGCGALLSENAHRCPACGTRARRPGGPDSQVSAASIAIMMVLAALVAAIFVVVLTSA